MDKTPRTASVRVAESDADIARCFPIMAELRPHLLPGMNTDAFVAQVRVQEKESFHLAYVEDAGEVRAVAGYRVMSKLLNRRAVYVDDLVTRALDRSKGYGDLLFDWLLAESKRLDCAELQLDSGVQRFDAHRFYLRKRMNITAHHFTRKIESV